MTIRDFMVGELLMVSIRGDKGRMRTEFRYGEAPATWFAIGIIIGIVVGGALVGLR